MKIVINLLIALIAFAIAISIAYATGIELVFRAVFLAFAIQWIAFIPAYIFQTEKFYDLTGSLTYLSVIWYSLVYSSEYFTNLNQANLVIVLLITFWALRLGSFLFFRVRKDGGDGRFDIMKTKFWWFLMTWNIQGMWVFLSLAAGLAAMTSQNKIEADTFLLVGTLIWILGFSIEVIADNQKSKFRSNPDNKDKFITTGIWSWSRHPNYFGEILLWIGITVIAFPVLQGWQFITLISPIFIIILLTQISGVRLLELRGKKKWGDNEEYKNYIKNTSVLIPLPPKK